MIVIKVGLQSEPSSEIERLAGPLGIEQQGPAALTELEGSLLLTSGAFGFPWRYQLPALVTLAPAGTLGVAVVSGLPNLSLRCWRAGREESFVADIGWPLPRRDGVIGGTYVAHEVMGQRQVP